MNSSIVVVTGANRGLGKEVSRQLAEQGYLVIATARRLSNAQNTVKQLGSDNLVALQLAITDPNSISQFSAWLTEQYGKLDVLINNAAIHYDTWQNVTTADMTQVQQAFDTNLFGAWRPSMAMLPLLKQSNQPRIVNVSSGAGARDSMSGSAPAYSLSKAALNNLTQMLHHSLRGQGFQVNAVCPGWVATDMGAVADAP